MLAVLCCSVQVACAQAAEHDHDAQHESDDPFVNTNPLSFDPDLAICTLVVFGLLLAVLRKFAWGPISKALDDREHKIESDIAAAHRQNEEARELLKQYEARLAAAQDEVRAIIEEARRDAAVTQQEILAKAQADATAEMNRAKREVETARDQALQQLAETSANLAVDLAGKIVRAKLNASDHKTLIDEAVSRFKPAIASKN
jgi:F-type H+-transporting ATPase subunit b